MKISATTAAITVLLTAYAATGHAAEPPKTENAAAKTAHTGKPGWVKVEGNEFVTGYADPSTIIKSGKEVKMLALVDFKTVSRSGSRQYLSMKAQHEYDCKGSRWRMVNFTYYSENMGKGETVHSGTGTGEWMPIMPGSGMKKRWTIACKK